MAKKRAPKKVPAKKAPPRKSTKSAPRTPIAAEETADDQELSGFTIDQLIKNHGTGSCGSPTCKIEAADHYVRETKKEADPWADVRALHVHTSVLMERETERAEEALALRKWYGSLLFELVDRLGGIVFTPTLKDIGAKPGKLNVENYGTEGFVLTIVPPTAEERRKLH